MTLPWYQPIADEADVFLAAWRARLPVLLRGPTGSGKTRFLEHMAARLAADAAWQGDRETPLVTVACHDDLTSSDLVGRWLLKGEGTDWLDGPLTRAARRGALCYLDEVVEARRDTTVVIHSLTDHRRELWLEKTGECVPAHRDFLLVASYNPQGPGGKALKPSTRQRFVALEFGHPPEELEARIVAHETGVDEALAGRLAALGHQLRHLEGRALPGGVSTRALVQAAQLVVQGLTPRRACEAAVTFSVTEDALLRQAIAEVVDLVFP